LFPFIFTAWSFGVSALVAGAMHDTQEPPSLTGLISLFILDLTMSGTRDDLARLRSNIQTCFAAYCYSAELVEVEMWWMCSDLMVDGRLKLMAAYCGQWTEDCTIPPDYSKSRRLAYDDGWECK
jgi:hypothetical protein